MAEDMDGFSPLDSLGPAYGKINQPSLDMQGLSPFEGDRITQKPINFPEPSFHPVMPGINLTRPQQNVRQNLVGSPGNPANKKATFEQVKNATRDYLAAGIKSSQSPDSYAKIYSYDAGPDSNAFYKRYMAYGQEKFDKIGFSPLRDNEALFNSRTTMMDDFNRMMTHSFVPLFTKGFMSGPKSLAKMLTGDFTSSDLGDAKAYEEAAAIGMSSKGGFTGFLNNSLMNFGYTAGIISEAVLEEVAGAVLAAPTGGASLFATTANNLRKIKGIGAAVDGMKAVKTTLNNLDNMQFARNFWSASKAGVTSKVGRFINPLENTTDAILDLRKIGATDNLTSLAALSKTAGGFYRDVRNINMAVSEARLESGMVENKVYDTDYKKYYQEFGKAPSNDIQIEMIRNAKDAALDTFYWNAGLIYASNKITFNNITGPRGGLRNFVKNTVDDVVSVGGGKFGNIGKIVYDNAAKQFTFEANNLKNLAKSWWKNPGVKTAGKTIGYLKGNFSEGIQENFQEVIARTNEKYYTESFNSKLRQAHEYGKAVSKYDLKSQSDIFKEELGEEFSSTQGFETFASGFFMGMFAAPLNASIPFLTTNYNRMFNKEDYVKYKEAKEKISTDLVKQLNDIDVADFLKSKAFNLGAQDVINEIKSTGSKKEAMDAELESLVGATSLMLETNSVDLFVEKLRSLNDADDAEFADALGNIDQKEVQKYRDRVNTAADKMEKIQDRYNYYKDKMPNPISQEFIESLDKKSDDYLDAVTLHNGWNLAVKNAVFFNESFEDTMSRMVEVQKKISSSTTVKNLGQRELGLLFHMGNLKDELTMQKRELQSLESMEKKPADVNKQIADKKAFISRLETVFDKYSTFDQYYNRQDYYTEVRDRLKEKLGRDVTDAELKIAVDKEVGKMSDTKKQNKVIGDLQSSIYSYIKHVAKVNEDTVFDDNLDKSFELLLDHYKLGRESRDMVEYINMLHNPGSVFEAAQRNQAWMKNLYLNRKKYFKDVVKKQMQEVESNALLNELANQGIFLSLEDFDNWINNGVPPKEFLNNVDKSIITPGTTEYDILMVLLNQAKDLRQEPVEEEETEEEPTAPAAESTGVKEADIEKELFSETDSKGRTFTVFSTTKEKDGLIKTTFTFNRSDKDPSQRNNMITGIPVEKALGDKYTIDEEYIPEGGKVVGVSEIRISETGAAATVTFEVYGETFQGEVKLNPNTTYDAELAALKQQGKAKPVPAEEQAPLIKPKNIQEVEDALTKLNAKTLVAKGDVYINTEDPEDTYARVSTLKGEFEGSNKKAADRGTIIDDLLRMYVDGTITDLTDMQEQYVNHPLRGKTQPFSKDFVKQLFDIFADVKQVIDSRNFKLTSRIPTMWGNINGQKIAGTIDLLAIDPEGNVYIIDLKTSSQERRSHYDMVQFLRDNAGDMFNSIMEKIKAEEKNNILNVKNFTAKEQKVIDQLVEQFKDKVNKNLNRLALYDYSGQDSSQQSGYAELLRQRTGITVKNIVIFPVQVTIEENVYDTAEPNRDENGKFTMGVTIDREIFPEILEGVKETPEGINVGRELSDAAKAKLKTLGFNKLAIDLLSDKQLEEAKTFETTEEASTLRDEVYSRMRGLGLDIPFINQYNIKKDMQIVSKTDVFITKDDGTFDIFVGPNSTVAITSINKEAGTVTLQPVGSTKQASLDIEISKLDELFMLESQIMEQPETKIENASEAKEYTSETNDRAKALLDSQEGKDRIAQIEKNIKASDIVVEDLDSAVLNDLEC